MMWTTLTKAVSAAVLLGVLVIWAGGDTKRGLHGHVIRPAIRGESSAAAPVDSRRLQDGGEHEAETGTPTQDTNDDNDGVVCLPGYSPDDMSLFKESVTVHTTSTDAITYTNNAIAAMGPIQACDRVILEWKEDTKNGRDDLLNECCHGLMTFVENGYFCDPLIQSVFSSQGPDAQKGLETLAPLCFERFGQLEQWTETHVCATNEVYGKVKDIKTINGGTCDKTDLEIQGERLSNVMGLKGLFDELKNADQSVCWDTSKFMDGLSRLATEDVSFRVPYGIGVYDGYQDVAEYLGISFADLNEDFWMFSVNPDTTRGGDLHLWSDGSERITYGAFLPGSFDRGNLPYQAEQAVNSAYFNNASCDTRFSKWVVEATTRVKNQPTALTKWAEYFVQIPQTFDEYGIQNICKYHSIHCRGEFDGCGNPLDQYPATTEALSEALCRNTLLALPVNDPKCGNANSPLAGNTLTCAFKHHFMVPANPGVHCHHIGAGGSMPYGLPKLQRCFVNTTNPLDPECTEPKAWVDTWPNLTLSPIPCDITVAAQNANSENSESDPGDPIIYHRLGNVCSPTPQNPVGGLSPAYWPGGPPRVDTTNKPVVVPPAQCPPRKAWPDSGEPVHSGRLFGGDTL